MCKNFKVCDKSVFFHFSDDVFFGHSLGSKGVAEQLNWSKPDSLDYIDSLVNRDSLGGIHEFSEIYDDPMIKTQKN